MIKIPGLWTNFSFFSILKPNFGFYSVDFFKFIICHVGLSPRTGSLEWIDYLIQFRVDRVTCDHRVPSRWSWEIWHSDCTTRLTTLGTPCPTRSDCTPMTFPVEQAAEIDLHLFHANGWAPSVLLWSKRRYCKSNRPRLVVCLSYRVFCVYINKIRKKLHRH